jgi:hypothetical protein
LSGLAGDDLLDGGAGVDTLNGGDGWDICIDGEIDLHCQTITVAVASASRSSVIRAVKMASEAERAMRDRPYWNG